VRITAGVGDLHGYRMRDLLGEGVVVARGDGLVVGTPRDQ
jgi:hypothetical protein